jgi:transposase-like protein
VDPETVRQLSFKRHRFPPEILHHSIWLYARFTLSFCDVEDLLAVRALERVAVGQAGGGHGRLNCP